MKLSHIQNIIAEWFKPSPMSSRATHTAYSEQVVFLDGAGRESFIGRIYDYKTSKLLEEFEGLGSKKKASKTASTLLKKYKK